MPLTARHALDVAAAWKLAPHHLTFERFREVPGRLRGTLAALLGVPASEVVLANSASYGINVIARAFPWREGDEVLVVEGDFPSDILPWLALEAEGVVRVRRVRPRRHVIEADELDAALTPATRVLCTTWVHSFSGWTTDVEAVGALCRERGVVFLVNASQGLGAGPLDLSRAPVDALVSIGAKWLCGPYGTGLLWMRPELRRRLSRVKAYWLALQPLDALGATDGEVVLDGDLGVEEFDVFGTANFFNFLPFQAAVEYLLGLGLEKVRAHDQALVSRLIDGLPARFDLLSPRKGPARSTLVFISHEEPSRNRALQAAMAEAGVDVSLRRGALRISPHVHNGPEDIDRALAVMGAFG